MKHHMKHKKLIISLAACAVIMAGIGGTYAVLTASTTDVTNTFKVEEVIETKIEEDWTEGQLDKTVSVKNVGQDNAFIRARVTISPDDVATWKYNNTDGGKNYWKEGSDGWYYYKKVVPPGGKTSPLMNEVVLNDSNFEGDFDVTVYQEAVGTGSHKANEVVDEVSEIEEYFKAIGK